MVCYNLFYLYIKLINIIRTYGNPFKILFDYSYIYA